MVCRLGKPEKYETKKTKTIKFIHPLDIPFNKEIEIEKQHKILENGLCEECWYEPAFIKTRKLCRSCYLKLRLAKKLGLKPPKSNGATKRDLIKNITNRYGEEILTDMKDLDTKPYWNLTEFSKKYGFTREYARQIYKKITGNPYGISSKAKTAKIKREAKRISCANDPRYKIAEYKDGSKQIAGAKIELRFMQECEKNGINVGIPCKGTNDFKVNGFNIEVKSNSRKRLMNQKTLTKQCSYSIRKNQLEEADFFACYHPLESKFFIIPKSAVLPRKSVSISGTKSNHPLAKNRYWEYKDAWHLLG